MITKLRGVLDEILETSVVIDVGGVGYEVLCSNKFLSRLPELNQTISLFTEHIIREDAHILLGFYSQEERNWYRLLSSVQGVGLRVALALLSVADPQDLAQAIVRQDKAFIARAEGVGPKLAARIANELKDKVSKLAFASSAMPAGTSPVQISGGTQDAISALLNLGYRQNEAAEAIDFAVRDHGNDATVEVLIRFALLRLSRT
ncbi:MAG: Holliday junction branch migration protein RuvA [Janthinobacterium lividum]